MDHPLTWERGELEAFEDQDLIESVESDQKLVKNAYENIVQKSVLKDVTWETWVWVVILVKSRVYGRVRLCLSVYVSCIYHTRIRGFGCMCEAYMHACVYV